MKKWMNKIKNNNLFKYIMIIINFINKIKFKYVFFNLLNKE